MHHYKNCEKVFSGRWTLALSVVGALHCACRTPPPKTVDEAGSVRVSVSSVGRWSDYRDALQPTFDLSEDKALDAVMPDTRLQEDKRLNSVGAGVAAALPTTITTNTVNTLPNGSPASDPGQKVVTTSSGDLGTLSAAQTTPGTRTAATLPGFDSLTSAALGKDPMLRYWAAAALFQEVKLLDRYIKNAAKRQDYVPYVVRLNVGLMPKRRKLSFDTYLNLSFFVGDEKLCADKPDACQLPEVLPLLVTDNVESALHSQSADNLAAVALALSGTLGTVGAKANIDALHEEFRRVLGRDLNSLLMVSRLTGNTLRIRFGAMQQVNGKYAMVPRNQFITAVVLVPESVARRDAGIERSLHVWSGMEFVNTKTGKPLDEKTARTDREDVIRLAAPYNQCPNVIEDAWQFVLAGKWQSYVELIKKNHACDEKKAGLPEIRPDELREMWLDIAQLQAGYSFDVLNVELPKSYPAKMIPIQRALLLDDGKDTTATEVVGGSGLESEELCASLKLGDAQHQIAATKITVSARGSVARLEFPSLKAWGLNGKAGDGQLRIGRAPEPGNCWSESPAGGRVEMGIEYRFVQPEPKVGFQAQLVSGVVVNKDGKGTLRFELSPSATDASASVKVSVSGADVVAVSTAYRDAKKASLTAAADKRSLGAEFDVPLRRDNIAVVSVDLDNVKAGPVRLTFSDTKGNSLPAREIPVEKAGS